jgi:Zn-finger nucleic acid-binding protein
LSKSMAIKSIFFSIAPSCRAAGLDGGAPNKAIRPARNGGEAAETKSLYDKITYR